MGARVTVQHVRGDGNDPHRDDGGIRRRPWPLPVGSDAAVMFLGEESILSGESHSRASIDLPGNQMDLVRAVKRAGKPVIVVILAGRPLTIEPILADADAVLYAWHPGVMAGPAIADILFGVESPSGKLPVTFPRVVGQVPLYYAHRNTGKPASQASFLHIDDIAARTPQAGLKNASQYLDAGYAPLYEFGYGLSYTSYAYSGIAVEPSRARVGVTHHCARRREERGPGRRGRGGAVIRPGPRGQRHATRAGAERLPAHPSRAGRKPGGFVSTVELTTWRSTAAT